MARVWFPLPDLVNVNPPVRVPVNVALVLPLIAIVPAPTEMAGLPAREPAVKLPPPVAIVPPVPDTSPTVRFPPPVLIEPDRLTGPAVRFPAFVLNAVPPARVSAPVVMFPVVFRVPAF